MAGGLAEDLELERGGESLRESPGENMSPSNRFTGVKSPFRDWKGGLVLNSTDCMIAQVQFPVPTSGSSQSPAIPASGSPWLPRAPVLMCTHTHTQTHMPDFKSIFTSLSGISSHLLVC